MNKKRQKVLLVATSFLAVSLFLGCPSPVDDTIATPATLAEQVVDELGVTLAATNTVASGSARSISSNKVSSIKAAALAKIKLAGFENSQNLDEILPSMIEGVEIELSGNSAYGDVAKSAIFSDAAKSALLSLGREDRIGNLKAGVTFDKAIGKVSNAAVTAVISCVSVSYMEIAIGSVTESAIDVVSKYTTVISLNIEETIGASIEGAAGAIASGSSDAPEAAKLITALVSRATASASSNGATIIGSDIKARVTAAFSDNGITITINVETIVNAVQSEFAPTANAPEATPATVTAANTSVALSVTGTPGAGKPGVAYNWQQDSGPSVNIVNSDTSAASVVITVPGPYVFSVKVTNDNGYKYIVKTVTVTTSFSLTNSQAIMADGIEALKAQDFDLAYTKFTAAYDADNANTDAVFWAALMNITSISTDPATVSLMKNRIGLVSYPSTMNALFSDSWFNSNWYDTKRVFMLKTASNYYGGNQYIRGTLAANASGVNNYWYGCDANGNWMSGYATFTPNETGTYYADSYSIAGTYHSGYNGTFPAGALYYVRGSVVDLMSPVALPRIEMPAWATPIFAESGVQGEDATHLRVANYPTYLALNLLSRNPDGLNAIIDGVLNGVFGTRLTKAIALIDALPDTAAVTIPNELIAAYSSYTDLPSTEIAINKAELKAFAASVQMTKSFVQLIASYQLDYPLTTFQTNLWDDTASETMLTKLYALDNPIKKRVLSTRNQATRDAAKATMLDALTKTTEAITLFQANMDSAAFISGMTGGRETSVPDAAAVKTKLTDSKAQIALLKAAISGGTSLYINPDALNGGTISDMLSTTVDAAKWAFNPSVLYSTDIFNPAKLFESYGSEASPTGLTIYGIEEDLLGNETMSVLPGKTGNRTKGYSGLAVVYNWTRVSELVGVPDDSTPQQIDAKYFMEFMHRSYDTAYEPLSASEWNMLDWIQGY